MTSATTRPPHRARGFTVLEVLVAIVCSAILISILYQTMTVVLNTSAQLRSHLSTQDVRIVFRRMLHRDLQNITDLTTLAFRENGFSFETGHNTLTGAPLTVKATWYFTDTGIYRIEESDALVYDSTMRITDLESWSLEGYNDLDARWLPLFSLVGASSEGSLNITAIRLKLVFSEDQQFEIVEGLPAEVPSP